MKLMSDLIKEGSASVLRIRRANNDYWVTFIRHDDDGSSALVSVTIDGHMLNDMLELQAMR